MEKYEHIKRDVSWLSFNHRVLQEAKDKTVPLYERIKFLAIYSSNLDEFFRVRVASLRSFRQLKKETRKELLNIKPKKELKEIRKIVQQQQSEFGAIFRGEILPELQANNITLTDSLSYSKEQKKFVKKYFKEEIEPKVPKLIYLKEGQAPPFLKNKALYFIIELKKEDRIGLLEIPTEDLPRFITLPGSADQHYITFLDDIIRFHLPNIVEEDVLNIFAIKVSRDAELYIDDEYSGDLLQKIKESLEERNIGLPTRFLYDNEMSSELIGSLKSIFLLKKSDLVPGARYHNFNDFFGFPDPTDNPDFHDESLPPLSHRDFEEASSILDLLKEKDVMLHFPYQKYDYVPKMIEEAANDPNVESIKITLYRVASKSAVVSALLTALEKGKHVVAFIEAKARFDEASNLFWGKKLEEAGGKVIYSYPGIKVHSKILLVSRKEEDQRAYYAYLGTGNFNEKTARLYCDHALMTSNPKLTTDLSQVFDILERKIIYPRTKHLLISPFTTRSKMISLIEKEISNAKAGKEAYMILKMNSLEDTEMINHLYKASEAGVKIKLIVRGICCLIPGVEGMSENIEAISIVDRFLEHARVYIFGNGGKEIMYTASADWMTRNLDKRIEVVIPIYDPTIYEQIRTIINLQLADNCKARRIDTNQTNPYKIPEPGEARLRAQTATYEYLKNNF